MRLAVLCGAGAALIGAAGERATRDKPPVAMTGGFGEDTCQSCHSEAAVGAGAGQLMLEGVPESYTAGERYTLVLTLVHPGVAAAGFELAARFEHGGAQAGTLAPAGDQQERLEVTTDAGVQYAHHMRGGTLPTSPDTARWSLVWTAPAAGSGTVLFHAVGNAANNDDSPLGDYIYAVSSKTTCCAPLR